MKFIHTLDYFRYYEDIVLSLVQYWQQTCLHNGCHEGIIVFYVILLYRVFVIFFHHCLDLPPVGWWTFNIIYIYWIYWKYTTPDDWAYWGVEWLSDTLTTTLFQFVAYYTYPYLEQYPFFMVDITCHLPLVYGRSFLHFTTSAFTISTTEIQFH